MIVELDGSQHAENKADKERTRMLADAGYAVLRYWKNEIFEDLEGVLEDIRQAILNARGN